MCCTRGEGVHIRTYIHTYIHTCYIIRTYIHTDIVYYAYIHTYILYYIRMYKKARNVHMYLYKFVTLTTTQLEESGDTH